MTNTVLIVEDNALNMKLFTDLLQARGYRVLQDPTGEEALAIAHEYRPDLVLMDMQLPGISGIELTLQLKRDPELHAIPVVAITASVLREDEQRFREAGAGGFISKPIAVSEFLLTIAGCLQRSSCSQASPHPASAQVKP